MQGRLLAAVLCLWLGFSPRARGAETRPRPHRPTDQELQQVVRRLLGKDVDPQSCQVVSRDRSYLIECRRTECHTCQVTYVITTLAQKSGLWAVSGTRRVRRGDTGECGCCM